MLSKDWYEEYIEEPLRNIIKILRNNGFNTFCSCGHKPKPYIQIEWYEDNDFTRLYNLLRENKYTDFRICGYWGHSRFLGYQRRIIEIEFIIMPKDIEDRDLINENEIKENNSNNGE